MSKVKDEKAKEEGRRKAAGELLSTEESYVQNLQILMKTFYAPMLENASSEYKLISTDDVRFIFGNLNIILPVNEELLNLLRETLKTDNPLIGDAFRNMAHCLKSYKQYCIDFEQARKLLAKLNESKDFATFLNKLHDKKIVGNFTLKDYLIMPVQRIPRYRMLLTEILKNTPEEHQDYEPMKMALGVISATAQAIEDATEKVYNMNKIIEIQKKLKTGKKKEKISLLGPRRFVSEEKLNVKENNENEFKKRNLFIFDDLILITKILHEGDPKKECFRLIRLIFLFDIHSIQSQADSACLVLSSTSSSSSTTGGGNSSSSLNSSTNINLTNSSSGTGAPLSPHAEKIYIQLADDKKEQWIDSLTKLFTDALNKQRTLKQKTEDSIAGALNAPSPSPSSASSTHHQFFSSSPSPSLSHPSSSFQQNHPQISSSHSSFALSNSLKMRNDSQVSSNPDDILIQHQPSPTTSKLKKSMRSNEKSPFKSRSREPVENDEVVFRNPIYGKRFYTTLPDNSSSSLHRPRTNTNVSIGKTHHGSMECQISETVRKSPSMGSIRDSETDPSVNDPANSHSGNSGNLMDRWNVEDDVIDNCKTKKLNKSPSVSAINKLTPPGPPIRKKQVPLAL